MSNRPECAECPYRDPIFDCCRPIPAECAECPLSDAFDGMDDFASPDDAICCESDPTTPRCKSCGVPLVKHLGLTGTCAEKTRHLHLLRRVIELTRLTVERCPAGYPDVAEFLREEEKRCQEKAHPGSVNVP